MIINYLTSTPKQITTNFYFRVILGAIIVTLLAISCVSKPNHISNIALQEIETSLWNRDSKKASQLLQDLDTTTLSLDEQKACLLYNEHRLLLQKGSQYKPEVLDDLTTYFDKHKLYKEAGHAAFIQGRLHNMHNQEEQAMLAFKQAEEYAEKDTVSAAQLLCQLYYQIARCYRVEKLSIVAYEYCEKALQYGYQTHNYYFLSETYKLMANILSDKQTLGDIPMQEIISMYDSALHYYHLTPNRNKGNFHVISHNKAEAMADTANMVLHSKYLVDSVGFLPNAIILTNYYLSNHQPDSARYYLNKFASDTLSTRRNTRWSKEQYRYYDAYCLLVEQQGMQAAQDFKNLYDALTQEVANTEQTRTYQVSRQYDVEKEQRERLEVEVEKQNLMILLIVVGAGVCILVLGFFVYKSQIQRKHDRLEAQNNLQKQQIESLNRDIKTKHESMRQALLRRIEFTRRVQQEKMRQSEDADDLVEQLPAWAQAYFTEQLLNNEQRSQELRNEFNTIYYHVLDQLQAEYPRLTKADMLMIVLIILQIPIAEMSLLLAMPKQSIWNRRNFLKEHLEIHKEDDLDEFIHTHTRLMIEKEFGIRS